MINVNKVMGWWENYIYYCNEFCCVVKVVWFWGCFMGLDFRCLLKICICNMGIKLLLINLGWVDNIFIVLFWIGFKVCYVWLLLLGFWRMG